MTNAQPCLSFWSHQSGVWHWLKCLSICPSASDILFCLFRLSARLWNWVHGEDWLRFACECWMLFKGCLLFSLFKQVCLLESRFKQVGVYSLMCLVATVCEEAIVVPEVGLSIWRPHQEFVCTWIRAQLPLHRVRCTLLLRCSKFLWGVIWICSHFCIVSLLSRLSCTAIYSAC